MTSALAALAASFVLGAAPPPTRSFEGLRPKQRGVCHTVFAGEVIEPMQFEVRGTLRGALGPGRDVLLVRLVGDKPEFTGVVAGMSGSPCFVDDQLIGALSYAYAAFAKEPIAGITPIADMLDVLALPDVALPWRTDASNGAAADPAADAMGAASGRAVARWPSAAHRALFGAEPSAEAMAAGPAAAPAAAEPGMPQHGLAGLQPIAAPLVVANAAADVLQPWASYLARHGFVVQHGAARAQGPKASPAPRPLVPGGSVAAVLVQGDVDVAATGTVTWVDGDKVLAFGHPFFGLGAVSMPMANASIVNTMASQQHSFKMAVTGATVGEVTQDRLSAIGGRIGRTARMVPVRGTMRHAGQEKSFAFDVVRDAQWTAPMVAMALSNALDGRVVAQGRGTVRLHATLAVAGAPPVQFQQILAGHHAEHLLPRMAQATAAAFNLLWNAPDGATPGEASIALDVTLDDVPHHERVDALRLGGGWAEVGDVLQATVHLARRDAPPNIARFSFAVPSSWAGDSVALYAAGAGEAKRLIEELTGAPTPHNRAQVAAWLQALRTPDQIYLLAVRQRPSLQHGGTSYAALPPSAAVLLAHAPSDALHEQALVLELRQPRDAQVTGLAHARLQVAPAR